MSFILRVAITTGALLVVSYVFKGIMITSWGAAAVAAVFLVLINATVRPILVLLTLPVTILSLGLFLLVLNALILLFVASFVPGITITEFWSAFWGSILMSVISTLANRK